MNVFVVEGRRVLTPPLDGTILPGITRRSILEIAPRLGLEPEERHLPLDSLLRGIERGRVTEIFAAGTAAVVTPIGALGVRGERITVGDGAPGKATRLIYEAITRIQYGLAPDPLGWMRVVPEPAPLSPTRIVARPPEAEACGGCEAGADM